MKEREIVQTYLFNTYMAAPLVMLALLTIQAFKEKSTFIFVEFWWIIIVVTILHLTECLFRYTRIDYKNKSIEIKDGLTHHIKIPSGSLKEFSKDGSIIYEENGVQKEDHFTFLLYNFKYLNPALEPKARNNYDFLIKVYSANKEYYIMTITPKDGNKELLDDYSIIYDSKLKIIIEII